MWTQKPSFRFEIDNFSKKETDIKSKTFVSGGCEWFLQVFPKGNRENHVSLYLYVANPKSLPTGWTRIADFYFLVLNHSDKVLYSSPVASKLFCGAARSWGFQKALPRRELEEKGVLKNDKLIVEIYMSKVVEGVSEKKGTVDVYGFQVLVSQASLVSKLFIEHPNIAKDFKPNNQMVKAAYMKVLLNLVEIVNKPLNNCELRKAHIDLCELIEQGFKLDWLKSKLDNVSLKRKKTDSDDSQVVQNLVTELRSVKSKLEEVTMKMKNVEDSDGYRVKHIEERLKSLEQMEMRNVKAKFEGVSLQTSGDESREQQEERIKNLEKIVLELKVELDKKKAESSADGFLLVDDVA